MLWEGSSAGNLLSNRLPLTYCTPLRLQGGEKMLKKLAMPFVKFKMDEAVTVGAHVLQERLPFDEQTCLKENAAFIMQALSLDTLSAFTTTDTEAANVGAICKVSDALPGTPAVDPTFAPTPAA